MGDLEYKLTAPQHNPYDLFYKPKLSKRDVWVAGRRCRKSTLLFILHCETCIRNPGVQTDFVAPVEKGLQAYIEPIVHDVLSDCPSDLQPKSDWKSSSYEFPNKSRVIFNGCNMRNYRYMRGQRLALATVDEMAEVDDLQSAVDDVLFPATWDSNGRIILSGTPPPIPDPTNPVMGYVSTAKQSGSYWHSTVYEAGYSPEKIAEALRETSKGAIGEEESYKIVQLCDPRNRYSVAEIYALSENVGISREALTVFLREFMAEFIRDESKVIVPEFSEVSHVKAVDRPIYYDLLYKASGADLGVADKTVAIFGYYDFKTAKIVIQREFALQGADVRTDNFAGKYRELTTSLEWRNRFTHWSDNSNLMLLQDLATLHQIYISATDKEAKAEWLNKVRILLRENRILIDPSCKLLIATLNGAFWKDDLKKDYGRTPQLGHMDALDALIYLVRNINMTVNPFPVNYNIEAGAIYDSATTVYPLNWDKIPHTDEGKVLQRIFSKSSNPKPNGLKMGGL